MKAIGWGRQTALWLAVCVAFASGCDCDGTRLKEHEIENDLSVSVRRAVSCGGADVELSPIVYGGKAPYTFQWEPPDGLSDPTARNPTAKGESERTYKLTVADAQGLETTIEVPLERRALPQVKLGYKVGAKSVCQGANVQLDASGTLAGNGKPVDTYSLDLGNGSAPIAQKEPLFPAFAPQDGQKVVLTVTDDAGCTASVDETFAVRALPTARLTFVSGTAAVCAGDQVALDGSGSLDADGQPVASYAWDLDGNASTVESHDALSGSWAPAGAPATLTVKDSFGCEAKTTQAFDVGALPTARIAFTKGAAAVCDGATVRLDGSGSKDAQGHAPATFQWDLDGDPATVESADASPAEFAVSAATNVSLTVTDARGCHATATQALAVHALPLPKITFVKGRANACAGDELVLSAETSTDASGAPVAYYLWDVDSDGTPESSGAVAPPFNPSAAQLASLIVTDAFGCSAQATQAIAPRARPSAVVSFVRGDDRVCSGDLVALDASGSRDADGRPVASYAWDYDANGSADSTAVRTTEFAPAGQPVRLTIADAQGCTTTVTQAIAVDARPVAAIRFTQGGTQMCENAQLQLDGTGSTAPPGQNITAYAWDLDGDTQTVESTRAQPDPLTITRASDLHLTVTATNGCTSDAVAHVDMRGAPRPVIAFSQGKVNSCAGDAVALTGAGSTDVFGAPITKFAWDVDGDGQVDSTSSALSSFVPNTQTVKLTVYDEKGCSATATQALTPRALPKANITFAQGGVNVCGGTTVSLDGTTSKDADGRPVASYAWDIDGDPSTIETRSAATGSFLPNPGGVTLTVVDAQGCTGKSTQQLTELHPPTAVISFSHGGALTCAGGDVLLDASASTDSLGQPVARVAWDLDGDSTTIESTAVKAPSFVPTGARTVSLTVWDARGCTATISQGITVRALPQAKLSFATGRSDACFGDTISLTSAGSLDADGNVPAKYAWDYESDGTVDATSAVSPAFAPAAAQQATLTVTDAKGCSATAVQALSPRTLPTPAITFVQGSAQVCSGANVTLDGSGSKDADGRPVASYAWDLDGNAATTEGTSWQTASYLATGTPARLTVTDAKGCRATLSQPIAVVSSPTAVIRFTEGDDAVCAGDRIALDGSASTDASGSIARYAWELDGNTSTVDSTAVKPPAFVPTTARTVSLTVWNAKGCSSTASQAIAVRAVPQVKIGFATGRADVCVGDAVSLTGAGTVDANGNPPASWAWDVNSDGTVDASTSVTPSFVPSGAQQVTLTVRDSQGCAASAVQALSPRTLPIPVVRFTAGSNQVCSGSPVTLDGSLSRDADGAPVPLFAWDLDGNASTIESPAASTGSYVPTGAPARLTVTDAKGCKASASTAIDVFARPTAVINFVEGDTAVCDGARIQLDGSDSVDGSGGPVSRFAWDLDGNPATVESTASTPPAFSAKQQIQPKLTVWDAHGCSGEAVELITARPLPTPQIAFTTGRADVCAGDSVSLSAAGSKDADGFAVTKYAWDLDGVASTTEWSSAATPSFSPKASFPVTVRVTDAFGCSASASQLLAPRTLPRASIAFVQGRASVCSGETVQLSGSSSLDADGQPVATYAWDLETDGVVDATSALAPATVPTTARTATLTVTDAKGCRGSATQAINPRALPTPRIAFAAGNPLVCRGKQVALDASGSRDADGNPLSAFAWDLDGNGTTDRTSATTGAFAPTASARASVKVTDAQGCFATGTQDLTVRSPPGAVITFAKGAALSCGGSAVSLSGTSSRDADGNPVAGYAWDLDGVRSTIESTLATTNDFTPTSSTTATLVTTDAYGCTAEASQAITFRANPTAAISFLQGAASTCGGSTVQLSAGGSRDADGLAPAAYAWDLDSDGISDGTSVASPSFTATGARTATLTITDGLGCKATATQAIGIRSPPVPRITFAAGNSLVCRGTQVALDASTSRDTDGNAVASYAWDLDGNGTIDRTSAVTGAYSPAATGPATLTVTDVKGCTASTTQALTVRALPTSAITFAKGGSTTCGGSAVALSGTTSRDADGNPVAGYKWDLDGVRSTIESTAGTTPDFTPASSVTATLTTTDGYGCTSEASQAISLRANPTAAISFLQGSANVCPGSPVQLSAGGSRDADGVAPTAYVWDVESDGTIDGMSVSSPTFSPTSPRTATLTVTDARGCKGSTTQAIGIRPLPVPRIAITAGSALVCQGGQVALDGAGSTDASGNPVSSFAWDLDGNGTIDRSSSSTGAFSPTVTGPVSLKVTDAAGCSASTTQPLTVRALPTARITFATGSADVCAGSSVWLSGSTSRDADGNAVASYAWDLDGTRSTLEWYTASTPPVTPTATTTTTLFVTDGFGCKGEASQVLTQRPLPVADAGADAAVCRGTTAQIGSAAQTGITYAWTPATGLDSATIANPRATPTSTTTYTVTAKTQYGCTASDSTQVTVNPLPVVDAGPDRQVSQGTSVQLLGTASGGTPGYSYLWTPPNALSSTTVAQPFASPNSNASYTLKVTDALGCFASDNVAVTVFPSLTVNAGPDLTYCSSSATPVTLKATTSGGVPPLSYAWTASPSCASCIQSPTAASTVVTPTDLTTFTVTVTDAVGTTVTDSVVLTPGTLPVADAGPDRQLRTGDWTQLGTPAQAGLTYEWSCNRPGCGLTDPHSAQTYAAPRGTTVYTLTVTNGGNCVSKDTVLVAMEANMLAAMPAEGTDPWPRDAPLWVMFDTDMNVNSFSGNVYLLDPTDGQTIWINIQYDAVNRMLLVFPLGSCSSGCFSGSKAYANNNPYLLVVKGGAGGVTTAGPLPQPLYNDLTLEFNASSMGDGVAPQIAFQRPAAGASGVTRDTQVVIKWSEHVDPRTMTSNNIWIEGVPSSLDYDVRTKQVFLRPATALAANTTYTVRIQNVIDARSSPTRINSLTTSFTFTTGSSFDTTPPQVVSFTPTDGAVGYDSGSPVKITFSEPIDHWTVGMASLVDDSTNYPVLTDVLYDDQTLTATLTPKGFIEPGRSYRIEVSDVYDWGANELPTQRISHFTTKAARLYQQFEAGTAGWSLDTPAGIDYQAAYVDYYGLSDSPGGNYAANARTAARTPALDVSGLSSVSLSFFGRQTLGSSDSRYVEYSFDGTTWTSAGSQAGCTGWRRWDYSIPTSGRSQMYVRVRLQADATVNLDGWFVDEMLIR